VHHVLTGKYSILPFDILTPLSIKDPGVAELADRLRQLTHAASKRRRWASAGERAEETGEPEGQRRSRDACDSSRGGGVHRPPDRSGPFSVSAYPADTATRVPAATLPRLFTSPVAFAQMLQGLARRISPGPEIGVRPKPMAIALPSGQ
jgi:hypothetical protein